MRPEPPGAYTGLPMSWATMGLAVTASAMATATVGPRYFFMRHSCIVVDYLTVVPARDMPVWAKPFQKLMSTPTLKRRKSLPVILRRPEEYGTRDRSRHLPRASRTTAYSRRLACRQRHYDGQPHSTQVVNSVAGRRAFPSGTASAWPMLIVATILSPSGSPTAARAAGSSMMAPVLMCVPSPIA